MAKLNNTTVYFLSHWNTKNQAKIIHYGFAGMNNALASFLEDWYTAVILPYCIVRLVRYKLSSECPFKVQVSDNCVSNAHLPNTDQVSC